jgi:hypothetical protein
MATSNFGFTLLSGSDQAGYNSINTLITSVDVQLYSRIAKPGMIMVFDTSVGSVPTGWNNLGTSISGSGLPTLNSSYIYIKKAST